jgi:uncharacterized protein YecE (DUF72 family)
MIRVGVAGWSYADWKGRVYPRSTDKQFHPLEYLANFFGCMEINSSFYALPKREYVREWARRVERFDQFRFAIKLHRDYTHGRFDERGVGEFMGTFDSLAEFGKLAAVLAQFHQDFSCDVAGRSRVLRIASSFASMPLVFELRHRSWFSHESLAWLEEEGISVAHIDMPKSADVVPQVRSSKDLPFFTGSLGYLRLHGRNDENWYDDAKGRDDKYDWMYARADAQVFADYARRLSDAGGDSYVITNNHFAGKAVVNALEIISALAGGPVPGPSEIVATYPQLRDIVIPKGQATLF